MPFLIVRDDIARVSADAIVNAANTRLQAGGGVCGALFAAAGAADMQAACDAIGGCPTGSAVSTPAFELDATWVIHAVGPIWRGGLSGEREALRSCYRSVFAEAERLGVRSVAYPLVSAGIYGFPVDEALAIAREETEAFLRVHEDVSVTLVMFDRATVRAGGELFDEIDEYIDDEYVEASPYMRRRAERLAVEVRDAAAPDGLADGAAPGGLADSAAPEAFAAAFGGEAVCAALSAAAPRELDDLLSNLDASFSETLLALIDERGMTDAEVYHRANLSRQLFSKIRSNRAYRPTKQTAVALAVALELDPRQTQDLLGRAGFALSRSSKFDVIVRFFLERGVHDVFRINEALFAYDQPLLGSMG
ncbi:MAG TPA: macro domain-containing protein [Candidatus Aphodovivens avicola]|nr:macro domain-containing protein [Candidatus Aphodovivens avicola]